MKGLNTIFKKIILQVIPVGKAGDQDFLIVDKAIDGKVHVQKALGVTYIPLTDREKQWPQKQRH